MSKFYLIPSGFIKFFGLIALCTSLDAATTINVTSTAGSYTDADNPSAITLVNALWNATSSNTTIDCSTIAGQTITLTQPLPAIMQSGLVLLGNGITIDGASTYPAFSVVNTNAWINEVTVQNAVSKGGSGVGGGGGGTGGGGAFYVENGASVTLQVVSMNSCEAIGGTSESYSNQGGGGGGGGYGGGNGYNGGGSTSVTSLSGGGGGGGHAGGANSGISNINSLPYTYGGGSGGNLAQTVGAPGTTGGNAISYKNNTQYYSGGNGAVGSTSCPSAGSGGGGGGIGGSGGSGNSEQGGNGGAGALNNYGGGGGGAASSCAEGYRAGNGTGAGGGGGNAWGYANAGNGGPSGGGGGGISSDGRYGVSGTGGFGAGGGGGSGGAGGGVYPANYYTYGTSYPQLNLGGSGGGVGSNGGGGSALGGAIFIQNGGTLTITDSGGQAGASFSNNSVEAGTGNQSGTVMGPDIFIRSGGTLIVDNNYENLTLYSVQGDGASYTGTTLEKTGEYSLYLSLKNDDEGNPMYTNYTGATKIIDGTIFTSMANVLSPNSYIQFSEDSNGNVYAPNLFITYDNAIGGVSSSQILGYLEVYDTGSGSSTLTINLANDASYTYEGYLYAGGANTYLVVTGDGKQVFTQDLQGSFGKITVSGNATLEIDGIYYTTGDPLVESGAILSGSGRISDTTIQGGGTIVGGNYQVPGPLYVDGYLIMDPNSTMDVAGTPTGFSSIVVSEDATIENSILNLELNSASNLIGSVPIAFLQVEGEVLGSGFTTVESNLFYITGTVTESEGTFFVIPAFRPFSAFVSDNANARAVGIALNEVLASGNTAFAPVVESFTALTQPSELETALNEMQPALFKGVTISQENNAVKVRDALNYRWQNKLDKMHCGLSPKTHPEETEQKAVCSSGEKRIHVWTDGFGDILRQKSSQFAGSPQFEYQTKTGGAVLGIDYSFAKYFEVGALGAYTGSTVKWENSQGREDIDTGYGGLYFSAMSDLYYVNLAVLGGWSHFNGHRQIIYTGTDIAANNSHGGSQLLSHLDTGFNFGWKNYSFRPFDSFDYITQTENSYTETGAGALNLHVKKNNAILIRNELGAQFAGCFCFGGTSFTVSPKISWVREVRVKGSTYTAAFENTPYYFEVTGNFPDRSLVSPGVMVATSLFQDLLSLDLYYNGEFGDQYSDHNYGGQIRFGF